MAILMVTVVSQPQPQKIPAVSADVSATSAGLSLTHSGGDTLRYGTFKILVDGQDKTAAFGATSDWAVGQTLTYPGSAGYDPANPPGSIQIVYTGGNYQQTIDQIWVRPPTLTTAPTATTTTTATPTPTSGPVPVANFTGSPLRGTSPLTVQFTDLSANSPTLWSWNFGDGSNLSTVQNPVHTYSSVGVYTVSLNATNAAGSNTLTRTNYVNVTISNFTQYIIQNNVFVYGTQLNFQGNNVYGNGATIIITGPLYSDTLNGGAQIAVSTEYIDGDVTVSNGIGMGSPTSPGTLYINGNLNLNNGYKDIYGDVYVSKNLVLQNSKIHGNMYVNGDVNLGWGVPTIDAGKYIYYTGTLTYPNSYDPTFLARCIKLTSVPGFSMPNLTLPSVKPASWYTAKGYTSGGTLASGMKVFANSYSSTTYQPTATNVVIVAANGDITLTGLGSSGVTGVLYAPNGKVTFNGGSFTGVVIARDGLYVTSGGTTVTFTNFANYFSSQDDYPF